MMTFFPVPHEDELLYSILARYRIYSGNVSSKSTLDDIYGNRSVTAVMDLPSHLDRIIKNMPIDNQYTSDELIEKYTLYPFYATFLPPERAEEIKEFMRGNKGGGIYNKIGLMASSITLNRYFKFCPQCIKEDIEKYGEVYWHRIHQISGVFICPSHKALLKDSNVLIRGFNKHEYVAATLDNCIEENETINISDNSIEKLDLLSKDVESLLNNTFNKQSIEWFTNQYVNVLIEKGLANINGNIKKKELLTSFESCYGDKLLTLLQSNIDIDSNQNWLIDLVRRKNKTTHPIRHLLLSRFLGISLDNIFNKEIKYKPFEDGPWPCLNPAASHYKRFVVNDLLIKYSADSKSTIGIFRCDCGFHYIRTGNHKEENDKFKITKVKAFGAVWENKLREVIEQKLSLRMTAKQLHVDPATVKKYAKRLGVKIYWENRGIGEELEATRKNQINISNDLISVKRNEWLLLTKQYPDKGKTELRQLNKALYIYLYRNDREWLKGNSPKKRETTNVKTRVDWEKRDAEILLEVKRVVNGIVNAEGKPERITITLVGSRLGIKGLLEKHLDKLPKTKAFLSEKTEDIRTFQIKRIEWAIEQHILENKELKVWSIFRTAGIRQEYEKDLIEEVENRI